MSWWSSLYLSKRFFQGVLLVMFVFVLAYSWPRLFVVAQVMLFLLVALLILDLYNLYRSKTAIIANRDLPKKLSNGDQNEIFIHIENGYSFRSRISIIDEVPFQFQARDLEWEIVLDPKQQQTIKYELRPTKRGEYSFGALNVFATTPLGLVRRRYRFDQGAEIPVYPSFLQMRKYELAAFTYKLQELGVKRIRRLGNTMEFEQIKDYVIGDDPRNINWKATARRNGLMINQYVDEKSQPVYAIVDKGRLMRAPFDEMSLLDYAINAALVISNIAIKKDDKAGIITFSNRISSVLPASRKRDQIHRIQQTLYNQLTKYQEANFELLSSFVMRRINQRSLLLIFSNFETLASFRRQLPYFVALKKRHLPVIIFFKNTGMDKIIKDNTNNSTEQIYTQVIAEKYMYEKQMIVKELKKYGIYSILTTPKNLSIDTINKYLELKATGVI